LFVPFQFGSLIADCHKACFLVIGTSSATPITYRCRAGVRDCKKKLMPVPNHHDEKRQHETASNPRSSYPEKANQSHPKAPQVNDHCALWLKYANRWSGCLRI